MQEMKYDTESKYETYMPICVHVSVSVCLG